VTVITSLCVPDERPEAVNTTPELSPGLPGAAALAVSTDVAAPPSIETVAIPQTLHLRPIHVIDRPANVNVAVAPVTSELPADPPLNAATSAPRGTHAPSGLPNTARVFSS
jgi:hypothetical protein